MQASTSEGASSEADEEESLASEPDVGGDAVLKSQRTWLVEQCLAWGGEQRLRLRLTLAFLPGDGSQDCDSCLHRWRQHGEPPCAALTCMRLACTDTGAIARMERRPQGAHADAAGPAGPYPGCRFPVCAEGQPASR